MKTLIEKFFPNFRLTIAITFITTLIGISAIFSIPKEEDPKLLNRNGYIKIVLPGATPTKLEEWVVSPLESRLLSVSSIKNIETKIRPDVAILTIELNANVKDTERAWNEIQRELDEQKPSFPSSVSEVELERDVLELEAILVTIEAENLIKLSDEAYRLKKHLEMVGGVKDVKIHGDPEIGINININPSALAQTGLTMPRLIEQIKSKNQSIPAGTFSTKSDFFQISTPNSLDSVSDIKNIPILFSNLVSNKLEKISLIERGESITPSSIVRHNGTRSIVLGIIPETPIDIIQWGNELKSVITNWKPLNSESKFKIIGFQPERSRLRIQELSESLLMGMASVIVILGLWMGWRTGVVVAVSVPIISIIGFGIYYVGGGVLHQISMAALLLSLGQFIDNVTVIAESAQRKIDEGMNYVEAAKQSADHFRLPMIFATGTAIAAFLPLLAAEGPTSEFTSSIPLIAVITLLVSYFFSLQATPILCALLLRKSQKPQKPYTPAKNRFFRKPIFVLISTIGLIVISLVSFIFIPKQFFPGADRNEFRISMYLPEGSSIIETDNVAKKVESYLQNHSKVNAVTSYIGHSTPHFYYSLITEERNPNRADFLVNSKATSDNQLIIESLRKELTLPEGIKLIPKILTQGPPTEAAIELEVSSDNYEEMVKKSHQFIQLQADLKRNNLRTTAPLPLKSIQINMDELKALEQGFDRNQLALQLLSWSRGMDVTNYFMNGDKFPIRINQNSRHESKKEINELIAVSTLYKDYKLSDFIKTNQDTIPSVIERKNGRRYVRFFSELKDGEGYDLLAPDIKKRLLKFFNDPSLVINDGGQSGESETANLAIVRALPLGFLLLIGCLIYEFKSFRKLLIVLGSVGLVALGTFPGLLIGGQAFGFTALLGILALSGIVVNNCILIIEAIEEEKQKGKPLQEAIEIALKLRTRPILLTTVMTFAGLLPLALEESTLWPPMAWAMISGLFVSTFISLFTIPEAYKRFFISILFIAFIPLAGARTYDAKEIITAIDKTDVVQAKKEIEESANSNLTAYRRTVFAPKLSASFERTMNDRNLFINSPVGATPYGRNSFNQGGMELKQTLLAPSQFRGLVDSKEHEVSARKLDTKQTVEETKIFSLELLILLSENLELQKLLKDLEANLKNQEKETNRLLPQGRTDPSDLTRVQVELIQNERDIAALEVRRSEIINELKSLFSDLDDVSPIDLKKISKFLDRKRDNKHLLWSLKALEQKAMALDSATQALKDSYLPQLELVGRYQNTEQGFLVENTYWYSVAVQVKWNIFDGGSNVAESRSKNHERMAVLSEKNYRLKKRDSGLETMSREEDRLVHDLRSFADTSSRVTKVLKKERIFYASGKTSLNQVLDTERLLIQQRKNYIQAAYFYGLLRLKRWHLEGNELSEEDIKVED